MRVVDIQFDLWCCEAGIAEEIKAQKEAQRKAKYGRQKI